VLLPSNGVPPSVGVVDGSVVLVDAPGSDVVDVGPGSVVDVTLGVVVVVDSGLVVEGVGATDVTGDVTGVGVAPPVVGSGRTVR
jgi:hypothetical protein